MKLSQFIKTYIFLIFGLFGLFLIALAIALNAPSPSVALGIFGAWLTISTVFVAVNTTI